jgi:hypothetical protein
MSISTARTVDPGGKRDPGSPCGGAFGHYTFQPPDLVGGRRALRDPATADNDQ